MEYDPRPREITQQVKSLRIQTLSLKYSVLQSSCKSLHHNSTHFVLTASYFYNDCDITCTCMCLYGIYMYTYTTVHVITHTQSQLAVSMENHVHSTLAIDRHKKDMNIFTHTCMQYTNTYMYIMVMFALHVYFLSYVYLLLVCYAHDFPCTQPQWLFLYNSIHNVFMLCWSKCYW